jgi:hypothetical protein
MNIFRSPLRRRIELAILKLKYEIADNEMKIRNELIDGFMISEYVYKIDIARDKIKLLKELL